MQSNATIDSQSSYLTKAEVESELRVSRATVDRLMRSRTLKYVKIGNSVRFNRYDLQAFISSNTR
jgi:excisionase family DNA binding protein